MGLHQRYLAPPGRAGPISSETIAKFGLLRRVAARTDSPLRYLAASPGQVPTQRNVW